MVGEDEDGIWRHLIIDSTASGRACQVQSESYSWFGAETLRHSIA